MVSSMAFSSNHRDLPKAHDSNEHAIRVSGKVNWRQVVGSAILYDFNAGIGAQAKSEPSETSSAQASKLRWCRCPSATVGCGCVTKRQGRSKSHHKYPFRNLYVRDRVKVCLWLWRRQGEVFSVFVNSVRAGIAQWVMRGDAHDPSASR